MSEPVIVDLMRHGAVAAEGWAFRGATDVPLSDEGRAQMRAAARGLEAHDEIAASPLSRCRVFAEELGARRGRAVTVLDDMREMDFGDWENRPFADIEREDGARLHRFWRSPVGVRPPNGECFDDFAARVIACWEGWIAGASGGRRLLVTHGGVIRVIFAHLLDMPMAALWRLHVPHAGVSRVSLLAGQPPRVLFINGLMVLASRDSQACAG